MNRGKEKETNSAISFLFLMQFGVQGISKRRFHFYKLPDK